MSLRGQQQARFVNQNSNVCLVAYSPWLLSSVSGQMSCISPVFFQDISIAEGNSGTPVSPWRI
eukprot:gnl/Chilomastix_caulleri/3658.p4 GENE.gnl/Chilomastix_caulleri/3658~~gnl/Chilomastix_caulleri/3658.p4  ORF type:complete len:63 (+),score=3.41 gnl/Chilomastix_caulleri/3658:81-269(+)